MAAPTAAKNAALRVLARRLRDGDGSLRRVNARDVAAATRPAWPRRWSTA